MSFPEPFAYYPLSNFDLSHIRSIFITGWLVEGIIDQQALRLALVHVTQKWRMLAGRLESLQENKNTKWRLKIPLGTLPDNYSTFSLTTSTSDVPLSHYISEPIPLVSPSLPPSLFIHPDTPRNSYQHEQRDHPLISFHLTFFHSENAPRTAIGFARPHSLFEASTACKVVQAIIAELKGQNWDVPPKLHPGHNPNELQDYLDAAEARPDISSVLKQPLGIEPLAGYFDIGISGALYALFYNVIKGVWWNQASRHIILLPKNALDLLVTEVRSELARQGKDTPRVSTGDILTAWIWKTIHSTDTSVNKKVHVSSFASFRHLLPANPPALRAHQHNTFITSPYPLLTVSALQSQSLASIAYALTSCRQSTPDSIKFQQVVASSCAIRNAKVPAFYHPFAEETLSVSNVSSSGILEVDWGCLSSKKDGKTLCGYRYIQTATGFPFVNILFLHGRLPKDESTVLDVYMTKERMVLLKAETERIVKLAGASR
ncbi:hypothetical protein VKT23_002587 [Stygiomarasmius scandens]|uniref:Uncharacterized protein n=1 Tax=Marasmiellus scandens TaxID=2682957 RepID=A0ABR1K3L5_9AGAR